MDTSCRPPSQADPGNAQCLRDLFVSLFTITPLLLGFDQRESACELVQRLDAQARLLAERLPHDRHRDAYPRAAADLLARACGPGAE
jgi:hypothetical protein